MITKLSIDYKTLVSDKKLLKSIGVSLLFLLFSIVINFYAGTYATVNASSPVTDIILSNIRVYDLDGTFIYGSLLFFLFALFLCLANPKKIPFVVKSVALFVTIRSIFITLTHIGPFPSQIVINSDILSKLTFGADLFFSGHTGMPFLLALIFWKNKTIRNIFLFFSFSFAVVVLLAHLHYSIDVLSAFFITFGIYHIAMKIFKKDFETFLSD